MTQNALLQLFLRLDPYTAFTDAADQTGYTFSTTYDANGNALTSTDGNGNTSSVVYDKLNRAVEKTDAAGWTSYVEFDPGGRVEELHEAATLRWPIEQCFEECKSYLGMGHFEGRSYPGFLRHLLFVMIAHFFITNLRLELKKRYPNNNAYGSTASLRCFLW